MSMHYSGSDSRAALQRAAVITAAVFALVGVLGFIPGVTTHYSDLQFAGHDSGARLLGLFGVSVLHNLVHLAFAAAGFALARTWEGARRYLIGGGVVYLVLALYGALVDRNSSGNFVPVDNADNWLHLALGLGMVGLGYVLASRDRVEPTPVDPDQTTPR